MNESKQTLTFWKWPLVILAGMLVLIVVGVWILSPFFLTARCANDQIVEAVSPNGRVKAVTFRRSCGATTGFSAHVSILPASLRLPDEPGNVFVTDDEPAVTVRWADDRHLTISGHTRTQFLRLDEFQGVKISYEQRW